MTISLLLPIRRYCYYYITFLISTSGLKLAQFKDVSTIMQLPELGHPQMTIFMQDWLIDAIKAFLECVVCI